MTSETKGSLPWTQPGWLQTASNWIETQLAAQGLALAGPIEQPHVRPWSTVLRVPSRAGLLHFKASAPMLGHEAALTVALARWRPDCMPEVLAADPARGWLLMRDELLRLGALDRRLAVLPAEYERLLADTDSLLLDQPDGLSSEAYQRLRDLTPRFAADCQRLADFGLPETLHHDDFHDNNIFIRDGRITFTDWGESCVAHPFFTTVVMLRNAAYTSGLPANAPEVVALRDRYLEPWERLAPRPVLLEACALAQRVGMVCRTLTWHRVVTNLAEPYRAENADAVPGWLGEYSEVMA